MSWSLLQDGDDIFLVLFESFSAAAGQADEGVGDAVHKFLEDLHIAVLFQFLQVNGKVTFGQAGFMHQVHKIGFFHYIEIEHDIESGRFVNDAVDLFHADVGSQIINFHLLEPGTS